MMADERPIGASIFQILYNSFKCSFTTPATWMSGINNKEKTKSLNTFFISFFLRPINSTSYGIGHVGKEPTLDTVVLRNFVLDVPPQRLS